MEDRSEGIRLALEELKNMQEILDDKEKKANIDDIRSILGHTVFSVTVLIEEFLKMKKKILEGIAEQKKLLTQGEPINKTDLPSIYS